MAIASKKSRASPQSRLKKHKNLAVILAIVFIDNVGLSVVYPIFSSLVLLQEIPMPSTLYARLDLLSLLIASFPFGMVLGNFLLGMLSDHIGRKKAFTITLIGESIGFALTALGFLYGSLSSILLGRFITGLAAGNLTLCLAAVADLSNGPKERTLFLSMVGVISALALIVGISLGGFLSDRLLGFARGFSFWLCALLALINWINVLLFFNETAPCHVTTFSFEPIRRALRGFFAFFFLTLGWSGIIQYLSADLLSRFHQTHIHMTFILILCGILLMAGNVIGGKFFFKKGSSSPIVALLFFVGSVAIFFAGFTESFLFFSFCIFIGVICAASSWLGITRYISLSTAECNQGKVFGTEQSILGVAMTLAPIAGAMLSQWSLRYIYYFTALTLLVAFFICPKKIKRDMKAK